MPLHTHCLLQRQNSRPTAKIRVPPLTNSAAENTITAAHLLIAVLETFLNSHGGIGYESTHNPRLASRASHSSFSSSLSFGAYRRNHHARPALTIS
jgi:hypothetical protein